MDYNLSRIDYTVCGVTCPDTLKILPAYGQKTEQKIVIGDKNGVLQCFGIKDEEPVVQFKTLPGKPITSVQLAAASGTQSDKIFTASGNEVKGYTRKGKVFLSIETALTETITAMAFDFRNVVGSDLILCSGRTVTYYRDLREYHSYVCEDRVLDIATFAAPNNARVRLVVLIANKGAIILENGQLVARTSIPSGPTRLGVLATLHTADIFAFYGASDGSIGVLTFEHSVFSSKCLIEGRGLGSVVCFGWFYNNGGAHLAVGRYDGSIQLYLVDLENLSEKPRLMFTYLCGEPVTSISGGCVGGNEEGELIAATFSGRVFALRHSRMISGVANIIRASNDNLAARRAKLEQEIARLEKQTLNEREKYQRSTRSLYAGLSTPPLLNIQHEISGATKEGWQELQITSAVPLDMLFIYCNKKLHMLTDSAAVLSICSSQDNASDMLATVRCQAGMMRVWVRMRDISNKSLTSRSESKHVFVYVLPAGAPRVARLITLKLPTLPFYSQHEELNADTDSRSRSWCQLQVTGSFSVAEITSWLSDALPGELPRPTTNIAFARSHTLLGTIIICKYQRSLAIFKSDDVSAIAIIRNIVSNCSVEKRIRLDISCDIPDSYCLDSFENIKNKLADEYQKHKTIILKNSIRSLDLDYNLLSLDSEEPLLCEDYMLACKHVNNDTIQTYFTELVETILQWYNDWLSICLHSHNMKDDEQRLRKALMENNLEEVINIFSHKLKPIL
ncbi:hypothetical protein K1T71_005067 [Dendrolimus kikuchii]|uniref:Uncharacterized protein n=1 Tax=Dendrolimus kikuchii TaxID=765133 RepID=A0ACC1D672_9NEOP|nr:hypothetical protein K1T71_005067 [Dendrolimus kikuchii]